jgi:hypothetical protein
VISQSEKVYHRGGGAASFCVRDERKLVILDKVCLYVMTLVAMHTVPAVIQLYNKATTRLHKLQTGALTAHTKPTEEKILDMLFAIPSYFFLFYLFIV